MKVRLLVAGLCAAVASHPSGGAAEQRCRPIAAADIERHWERYRTLPGARDSGGGDLYQCIMIDSTKANVCRTQPGNPAHPSIVIRTMVQDKGGISIRTEADTAGDCSAFLEMMRQFLDLDRKIREDIEKRRQSDR